MTKIIFIRHAKSDHSIKNDKLRPLTESGKHSAKSIPKLFKEIPIDFFYSSPYVRSLDTIKYLAKSKTKEIIIANDLRGRIVGDRLDDFMSYAKNQWKDFTYKLKNGESISDVQSRYITELNIIL